MIKKKFLQTWFSKDFLLISLTVIFRDRTIKTRLQSFPPPTKKTGPNSLTICGKKIQEKQNLHEKLCKFKNR